MKQILLVLLISFSSIISNGQEFINVKTEETTEIVQTKTGYNDFIEKTHFAPEGMKFIIFTGEINDKFDAKTKVSGEELFFTSGNEKFLPIGYIDYGSIKMKAPYFGFELGRWKIVSYIYVVNQGINSGVFEFGTITPITANSFTKYTPSTLKPELIKVVSQEKLDAFEDIDFVSSKDDFKSDIRVKYLPKQGSFIKLNIEVLPPKKEKIVKGENYTFHPSQFYLVSKEGIVFKCVAFIRSGDDLRFAESMNHGVLYTEEEVKTIELLFHFSDLLGEFYLYHDDIKHATIQVK